MDAREIKQYLIDTNKKELPKAVIRSLSIPSTKKIIAVIGPRRAGKTFYLYQIIHELVGAGIRRENIIYLNFENTRLFDIKFDEIPAVIDLHKQEFPDAKDMILFLDEPQNIDKWELTVRQLHDEGYRIFLSGSSSKLLSKEIATSLRGRSLSYLMLPFSFSEFLQVKGVAASKQRSSDEKTKIRSLLDEYLEFGGFPEVAFAEGEDLKLKIIESYFDLTVYKDIVERHKIKDSLLVKWLIKTMSAGYAKEISINKLYLTLKSQGRKVSKDELYSHASLINDSLFIIYLPRFSWSVRAREPTNKAYLCDVGFAKLSEVNKDIGRKMENAVFLELTRRLTPLSEIFFWKNVQQEEVDFVAKEKGKVEWLIQVCADVQDRTTKEREIRALLKAGRELKCDKLLIISDDYEAEEDFEWFGMKGTVRFIPLWKWLLRI
jgi:hypothetical protein